MFSIERLRHCRRIAKNFEVNVLDEPVPPASTVGSLDSASSFDSTSINKLRLPTPRHQGETLQFPPLNEIDSLWQRNLAQNATSAAEIEIGGVRLAELQSKSRAEVWQLASHYSRQYGDFHLTAKPDHVVMAGHQPELFHPGVWYKNFVLSELGQRFNCAAINLVVDNDICANVSIRTPLFNESQATTALIPFDGTDFPIPHEERTIEDFDCFRSFQSRAAESINPFVSNPLVSQLWPHVLVAAELMKNHKGFPLGLSIAAGRHRLEAELGLQTLEVPLSQVANSRSFAVFMLHVFSDLERFRDIYNASLAEYKDVYRLRSKSHPVPELERKDDWIESPFWVWRTDSPFRKRLYVRMRDTSILLSDLETWQTEVKEQLAVDEFCEFATRGIKIRPRALMTTMFSRLVLSDLFIHGIGGAKYDQLTDLISRRFFGHELPKFGAVSATQVLPTGSSTINSREITATRQTLRELKYQPERFIDAREYPDSHSMIQSKLDWIRQNSANELVERHRAIVNCNDQLQTFVESQRQNLEQQIDKMSKQLFDKQILGSREFSFCLFPESLIGELQDSAHG